jgi:hypothetical protein
VGDLGEDLELLDLLLQLSPPSRDKLRKVLIRDQADRDAISSRLTRYRNQDGDDWADIIDMLTMHPDERRQVVRLLGEIEAGARSPNFETWDRICELYGWPQTFVR